MKPNTITYIIPLYTKFWFDEAERILNAELTTEILINVIERKLKNNNDWTLNNLKVDYSQRSEDIEYWITKNVQHKDRPVFIQLEDDQPIITSGSGTLFVFYEDDEISTSSPDGHYLFIITISNISSLLFI